MALIPKQLERHGSVLSTVATDALVPKHQVISIHSDDIHCTGPVSYQDITFIVNSIVKLNYFKSDVFFRVNRDAYDEHGKRFIW